MFNNRMIICSLFNHGQYFANDTNRFVSVCINRLYFMDFQVKRRLFLENCIHFA